MGRKGRVIALIALLISVIGMSVRRYFINGSYTIENMKTTAVLAAIFGVFFYWVGNIFDQNRFYLEKLSEKNKEFHQMLENADIALWSFDISKNTMFTSADTEKIFGVSDQNLIEDPMVLKKFVHVDDIHLVKEKEQKLFSGEPASVVYRIIRGDGEVRWIKDHSAPIIDSSGNVIKINGVASDITDIKNAEKKIHSLAYYDALTGLPNKNMLYSYFSNFLLDSQVREKGMAVILLDLDHFKLINDTMGHSFGDYVLQEIAKRIEHFKPKKSALFRYGGDEFVMLAKCSSHEKLSGLANKLLSAIACPINIKDTETFISASIGISLYPENGCGAETLIKNADTAMNFAKESGRNNYRFYMKSQGENVARRMELSNSLKTALANNELFLNYQPQVNLHTGEIVAFEALIRWNHPKLGHVSPGEFIPIAEETGIILPIGEWVLETACMQNKLWKEKGFAPVKMAVNVSPRQFQDKHFIETVKRVLEVTELDPKYIELEITESIMQDIEQVNPVLQSLKALGIGFAIDDFGTGYSSLSILRKLPVGVLKIDKSFVDDIGIDLNAEQIIKTIIDMGKNLNFNIIAEGIEKKEQMEFLKKNNCEIAQGYFFDRPLSEHEIEQKLESYSSTAATQLD